MATDEERLLVSLEARVTDFEKKMAQAERRGTRTYTGLRKSSASATKAMETDMNRSTSRINQALASSGTKIGGIGKAWAVGLVGGVVGGLAAAGIGGIVAQVGRIANSVATVGDEAKRAGVSAKAFQEWKFVAEQNRIGIDAMVDGLKELNLRADEFAITGKGSAAEAFQRLGYGAEEVKRKLEDPSELLLEIIGRLGQMDKAAQIRIADELFGGSAGERFVELLDQGEAGIRRTIGTAHDLGVVMDDELIAKAAELDRKFQALSATVGTALKSAIVSAATALTDFINRFREFKHQNEGQLRSRQLGITGDMADAAAALRDIDEQERMGVPAPDSNSWDAQRAQWERVIAERKGQLAQIEELLVERDPPERMQPPGDDGWTPPAYTAPSEGSSGKGSKRSVGRSERADEFEREVAQLVRRTAALKAGTLAQAEINPLIADFGLAAETASARTDLLLAAQEAGIPITAELRAQVEQLAQEYGAVSAASAQLDDQQAQAVEKAEMLADLRRETIGGFAKDLLNGVDAADAFANALGRIGDRMLDLALDSIFTPQAGAGGGAGGVLGGILGGLFGRRERGGPVTAGRPYIVGERRPELFVPDRSGTILPRVPGQRDGQEGKVAIEVKLSADLEARLLAQARQATVQIVRAEGPKTVAASVRAVQEGNRASSRFLGS